MSSNLLFVVVAYSTLSLTRQHGYVASPPSRSYLCKTRENVNCDLVSYEPQSLEGPKRLVERKDFSSIASASIGRFAKLDEYGVDRWKRVPLSSFVTVKFDDRYYSRARCRSLVESGKCSNGEVRCRLCMPSVTWHYTARHKTSTYETYVTNGRFHVDEPLRSDYFHKVHTLRTNESLDTYEVCMDIDTLYNERVRGRQKRSPFRKAFKVDRISSWSSRVNRFNRGKIYHEYSTMRYRDFSMDESNDLSIDKQFLTRKKGSSVFGVLLFIWNIGDTSNAFYQVVDFVNDAVSLSDFCESKK